MKGYYLSKKDRKKRNWNSITKEIIHNEKRISSKQFLKDSEKN